MMAENPIYCPAHEDVKRALNKMEDIQKDRPCGINTTRIEYLEKADVRIEATNKDQWTAINSLRRLVWGGTAVMALLGSVAGNLIINLLRGKP